MLKFSAVLACATGIILAIAVTTLHWNGEAIPARGSIQYWVIFVLSYFAPVLSFTSGWATLRGAANGPLLLFGSWFFMAGLACGMVIFLYWLDGFGQAGEADPARHASLAQVLMAISSIGIVTVVSEIKPKK